MAWTNDVLTGLAQLLATAGVGVWNPTGVYAAVDTGIVIGAVPPSPDGVITLTAYPVDQATAGSDTTLGVQVRCRAAGQDPRPVNDLADAVFEALHGRQGVTAGPAVLALIWRASHVILGQDANGRWQTSSNFYAVTSHATTAVFD